MVLGPQEPSERRSKRDSYAIPQKESSELKSETSHRSYPKILGIAFTANSI